MILKLIQELTSACFLSTFGASTGDRFLSVISGFNFPPALLVQDQRSTMRKDLEIKTHNESFNANIFELKIVLGLYIIKDHF